MTRHRQYFTDAQRLLATAHKVGCTVEEYTAHKAAGEKWCWRCRSWQPLAAFGANRSNPDGVQTACRPCKRAYARGYESRGERGLRPVRRPTPIDTPPAPPQRTEALPVEESVAPPVAPLVAAITAEWDAAYARRLRQRELRRAERRRA